jgi:integrase
MSKHSKQYPGASAYRDRHGQRRWRFRAKGFSAQLGRDYGSPEFVQRYESALKGQRSADGVGSDRTRPGTIDSLAVSFYGSPGFLNLADGTRRGYTRVIDNFRAYHGGKRVAQLGRRHILDMMAAKSETPSAANEFLRILRLLMNHAVDVEVCDTNPTAGVKRFKVSPGGIHSWSEDEISRYYEVHPLGTTAHLAMTLMLYTGAAKCDAVALGWANVKNGRITYRRMKTRRTTTLAVDIPLHPELAEALEILPRDCFTFLETRLGKSRSSGGLGKAIRRWCDAAGLPGCTAHGLRKACARRLAEAGATVHQIAAVTGHATLKEVERYTRDAARSGLADAAFDKQETWAKREQGVANHPKRFAKKNGK